MIVLLAEKVPPAVSFMFVLQCIFLDVTKAILNTKVLNTYLYLKTIHAIAGST